MSITLVDSTTDFRINGNTVTLTLPATVISGDLVVACCAFGTAVTGAPSVTSSSGGAFTQAMSSVFQSSNIKLGIWYQYSTGQALAQVLASGTGGTSDTVSVVALVLRGASSSPLDATATTTAGSGTTPVGPVITPVGGSSGRPYLALTAFAAGVQDTAVTEPSGWTQRGNANASDNRPSTCCVASLTLASSGALSPGNWTNLTSATWVSATLLFESGVPDWIDPQFSDEFNWRKYSIVGY